MVATIVYHRRRHHACRCQVRNGSVPAYLVDASSQSEWRPDAMIASIICTQSQSEMNTDTYTEVNIASSIAYYIPVIAAHGLEYSYNTTCREEREVAQAAQLT
jgi:hypothetical protein